MEFLKAFVLMAGVPASFIMLMMAHRLLCVDQEAAPSKKDLGLAIDTKRNEWVEVVKKLTGTVR